MRIICAWCLQEGKIALLGEKVPLDDLRETHGICRTHLLAMQAEWRKSLFALADGKHKLVRLTSARGAS
ncbi:MAG: hypothetical protein NNA21_11645 [Nitrospira sp.]|nr:hypothetical protein [Nitrospira sp.]MCP9462126.1 hypothetical protein [Nitrospira sp.]MCP9473877.1 hypothetical protein [Nitrospira sp.]